MHFKNSSEWDQKFSEQSLMVEELLSGSNFGGIEMLSQSKIRIALENNIISWNKHTDWLQESSTYPIIKNSTDDKEQKKIINLIQENYKTFAHYELWSEDLLPYAIWDNHLIILGLFPHEKLIALPQVLFVLCPPEILKKAYVAIHNSLNSSGENINPKNTNLKSQTASELLSGLHELDSNFHLSIANLNLSDLDQTNPNIQINSVIDSSELTQTDVVWNKIDQNHNQSSEIARKTFDAYVVLKIKDHKTMLYKMDEDLLKEKLAPDHFEFDLTQSNPLSEVLKNGLTSSISLSQLNITILDFKYACITPLKIGAKNVGFLVGFKASHLSEEDEKALESVSRLNAA